MLERAGANVLLPRERDVQTEEAIADNDAGVDEGSSYVEFTGDRRWFDAGTGFAHRREVYVECQNPFAEGTARGVQTVTDGRESRAEWSADLPASGEYAVYVSYKTVERSSRMPYTVRHLGGESRFAVNQTMGGGTWIYLGTFRFAAGQNPALVTLSNRSSKKKNRVVTADAVKIGGGMGNVARTPAAEFRTQDTDYFCEPSGYPRFCEGARYWLQWAGFPETVYRQKEGLDDYKEDYMSRAHWVNALMGGSERLPDEEGLNIPVDMALAFHSDAGVRRNDETIGTLGIYFTQENGGRFEGGASRYLSRDLTDLVMSQIVGDIRATYEPGMAPARDCGIAPTTKRAFLRRRRCCSNCCRTKISPTCVTAAIRASNSSCRVRSTRRSCATSASSTAVPASSSRCPSKDFRPSSPNATTKCGCNGTAWRIRLKRAPRRRDMFSTPVSATAISTTACRSTGHRPSCDRNRA